MASNLDRFKKELDDLVAFGGQLDVALVKEAYGEEDLLRILMKNNTKEESQKVLDNLPNFREKYNEWYSESMAVIKQAIPDRLDDFKSFYDSPKSRKEINNDSYVIRDFLKGITVNRGDLELAGFKAAVPLFSQQLAILKAAKKRFSSSLFEIRQIVQADLFDSEIDEARVLLKGKFFRAAGAVAGVILEKHLKQVCDDHKVSITKTKPGIAVLNQALRDADVIDIPQWRFNQHLADIRNLCDHSKAQEPSKDQVQDLIDGVAKVLKTIS